MDDENPWPIRFDVGRVGFGFQHPSLLPRCNRSVIGLGVGCGIGIGVGKPLQLGAFRFLDRKQRRGCCGDEGGVPVVGDVMGGISTGLGQLPFIGSIAYRCSRAAQHVGIPHFGAGLGCGVGIGYGYGAGCLLKENALKKTQSIVQRILRIPHGLPHRAAGRKGGLVDDSGRQDMASLASQMAQQTQEMKALRQQYAQMKDAFCRVHPEEAFCQDPSEEDTRV